uniref:Uncharacterized protein n=1 Tax=Arion vulgaris TaxID=1028688 RepID=A0A0B7A9E9_9EUPU
MYKEIHSRLSGCRALDDETQDLYYFAIEIKYKGSVSWKTVFGIVTTVLSQCGTFIDRIRS